MTSAKSISPINKYSGLITDNDGYNKLIVLMAVTCLSVPLFLLGEFLSHTPTITISQDSLDEIAVWVKGEPWAERLRRGGAASWPVSLALYLDVYIGPPGFWFRTIAYAQICLFTACLWAVSKKYMGLNTALMCAVIFVWFWFLRFNVSAAYFYIWRVGAASSQLATIGLAIFLISKFNQLRPRKIAGLMALAFVFSQVYAGYVIILVLLGFLIVLDTRKSYRLYYTAGLAGYIFFMIFIDGVFIDLWTRVSGGSMGQDTHLFDIIKTGMNLVTRFFTISLPQFIPAGGIVFIKAIYILMLFGLGVLGAYRTVIKKDKAAAIFGLMIIVSAGTAFMAVVGRYGLHGNNASNIPHYFSYALMSVFSVFWYVLTFRNRWINIGLIVLVITLFAAHTDRTRKFLRTVATANSQKISSYASYLLSRDDNLTLVTPSRSEGGNIGIAADVLIKHDVLGLGPNIWRDAQAIQTVDRTDIPACEGRIRLRAAKDDQDFYKWDYNYTPGQHDPVQFGVVVNEERSVALAKNLILPTRAHMAFYVPKTLDNTVLLLVRYNDGNLQHICQTDLQKPM